MGLSCDLLVRGFQLNVFLTFKLLLQFIIIIIIIIIILLSPFCRVFTIMYLKETNQVSTVYRVTVVLYLQFVLFIMLTSAVKYVLYF